MTQHPPDTVDCCVAGCGPAGAMLGLLLARAGLSVAVFEKHSDFLRDFRGDTVHPSTLEVLDELGLAQRFLQLPHTEVERAELELPGARFELDVTHFGGRYPFVAFVPQWDFLDFITREARGYRGFRLEMSAETTGLLQHDGHVDGLTWRDARGRPREQRATLTVAADGRSSVVREAAKLPLKELGSALDILWFRLPRPPGVAHMGLKAAPGVIIVFFPRVDSWQVGYAIAKGSAKMVRARGLERFKEDVTAVAPQLKEAVGTLRDFDHVKMLTVRADRLERWWRPGFLAIGDAAHAMSPVGGVGINLAIQDAVTAANVLCEPLARGRVADSDLMYVQHKRLGATRRTQALQSLIEKSILDRALDPLTPFRLPWLARLLFGSPGLRQLVGRTMLYGANRAHVKTPTTTWAPASMPL